MSNTPAKYNAVSLNAAKIITDDGREIDIAGLIVSYSFHESMESVAMRGSVRVIDTVGLLEKTPLMGEERLILSITGKDYETKKKLELFVYKIDTVVPLENYSGLSYTMHFLSLSSFQAGASKITAAFNKPASQIAQDIFDRGFEKLNGEPKNVANSDVYKIANDRTATFEKTDGDLRCIIPTYQPSEAMHFLTTKSFSERSSSCSFRFFETMDGYVYATDEFLIRRALEEDKVKKFIYSTTASISPYQLEVQKTRLDDFVNSNRADTAQDMRSGAYASNIMIVDLVTKSVENHVYRYKDDANFTSMKGDTKKNFRHSNDFVDNMFNEGNEKRMIFMRDYDVRGEGQLKGDEHIPLMTSRKLSYDHMIKSTAVRASIGGRLDIRAGDVLDVTVLEMNASDERGTNKQLTGNYIVYDCLQNVEHGMLKTSMMLIKYGWDTARV